MTKTINRVRLVSRGHVRIAGNLKVSGSIRVGGDLTIEGDLLAGAFVHCLGRIVTKGVLRAGHVIAGMGIEVAGDFAADSLDAYGGAGREDDFDDLAEEFKFWCELGQADERTDHGALSITNTETLKDLQLECAAGSRSAVDVGGDCVVSGRVRAAGDLTVRGLFNPDDASIDGSLVAREVFVEGDLDCSDVDCVGPLCVDGDVDAAGSVSCSHFVAYGSARTGELEVSGKGDDVHQSVSCSSLDCHSVSTAGSIVVDGPISCTGYLKADGSVTAAGPIKVGKGFGVLAGLGVATSDWLERGFVCAPVRPRRILTGKFRLLAKRRGMSASLKPVRLK